jgi:hypothetical protein
MTATLSGDARLRLAPSGHWVEIECPEHGWWSAQQGEGNEWRCGWRHTWYNRWGRQRETCPFTVLGEPL